MKAAYPKNQSVKIFIQDSLLTQLLTKLEVKDCHVLFMSVMLMMKIRFATMDASNPYHKQIQSLPLLQLSKEMLVIS